MTLDNTIDETIKLLQKEYPDSKTSLDFKNPFQLLVATILSAQTTDKAVNKATPELFKKYPNANELSKAEFNDVVELIRSIGLYNNKAKNLLAMSVRLVENFNGEVPANVKDLTSLPGVGRKTATAVLANAFGITDQGITVDTHMMRICRRLGWTKVEKNDAKKIEKELMNVIPQKHWGYITHLIIDHGRAVCLAQKPRCSSCIIETNCPSSLIKI